MYISHDKQISSDEEVLQHATMKALCFRSQRKNEEPHKLILKCEPRDDDNGIEMQRWLKLLISVKPGKVKLFVT